MLGRAKVALISTVETQAVRPVVLGGLVVLLLVLSLPPQLLRRRFLLLPPALLPLALFPSLYAVSMALVTAYSALLAVSSA